MSRDDQPAFTNRDGKNDHDQLTPTWCANNNGLAWRPDHRLEPDGVVPNPNRPGPVDPAARTAHATTRSASLRESIFPEIGLRGLVARVRTAADPDPGNPDGSLAQSLPIDFTGLAGRSSTNARGVRQPGRGRSVSRVRVPLVHRVSAAAVAILERPAGIRVGHRTSQSGGSPAFSSPGPFQRRPYELQRLQTSAGPVPQSFHRAAASKPNGLHGVGALWADLRLSAVSGPTALASPGWPAVFPVIHPTFRLVAVRPGVQLKAAVRKRRGDWSKPLP